MALTLIESSKQALGRDEVHRATIMELFARGSDLLTYMPFDTIAGNSLSFVREKTLPGAGFRGVNEAYTEETGTTEKVTESLAIAGGDLDVDKFLIDTGGADQRGTQEAMKTKALSLSLAKTIIKGDVLTNPKSFDGLQVRCTGVNLMFQWAAARPGAGALSLTRLDQLIDMVDESTHLIMNPTIRRRLSSAARTAAVGGYITYELDAFGRRVTYYNDLPILLADKDENNNDIMPFTEANANVSSGSTSCSVYCVSLNDTGVMGIQSDDMDVRDLGEQDAKPVFRTRIEWYVTLGILRPRAAARLYSIGDAVVVP